MPCHLRTYLFLKAEIQQPVCLIQHQPPQLVGAEGGRLLEVVLQAPLRRRAFSLLRASPPRMLPLTCNGTAQGARFWCDCNPQAARLVANQDAVADLQQGRNGSEPFWLPPRMLSLTCSKDAVAQSTC